MKQLSVALDGGRVVVTFDPDFVELHHSQVRHAGMVHVRAGRDKEIGRLIEILRLVAATYTSEEMMGRLEPF